MLIKFLSGPRGAAALMAPRPAGEAAAPPLRPAATNATPRASPLLSATASTRTMAFPTTRWSGGGGMFGGANDFPGMPGAVGGAAMPLGGAAAMPPGGAPPSERHNTCSCCLDAPINTMIKPCNHLVLCEACAAILCAQGDVCPICRGMIESTERVHLG